MVQNVDDVAGDVRRVCGGGAARLVADVLAAVRQFVFEAASGRRAELLFALAELAQIVVGVSKRVSAAGSMVARSRPAGEARGLVRGRRHRPDSLVSDTEET